MLYVTIVTYAITISLATSLPTDVSKSRPGDESEQVVYVPYDVNYIPIELPLYAKTSSNDDPTHAKKSEASLDGSVDETTLKHLQSQTYVQEVPSSEEISVLPISSVDDEDPLSKDDTKASSSEDPSKATVEDLLLVPVSALRGSKEDAEHRVSNSDRRRRLISKRQAPGDDFLDGIVYRPVVRYGGVFRDRRRVFRNPGRNAFVGYLNDFDNFPTVA